MRKIMSKKITVVLNKEEYICKVKNLSQIIKK